MIRMIQRRLIIPRGDTGSFTIPVTTTVADGDIAIFSIYDPLTRTTVASKEIELHTNDEVITVSFTHDDTVNLEPKKYLWDIVIYNGPVYDEEDKLIDASTINSYYAAFSLPTCEVKEVAQDV